MGNWRCRRLASARETACPTVFRYRNWQPSEQPAGQIDWITQSSVKWAGTNYLAGRHEDYFPASADQMKYQISSWKRCILARNASMAIQRNRDMSCRLSEGTNRVGSLEHSGLKNVVKSSSLWPGKTQPQAGIGKRVSAGYIGPPETPDLALNFSIQPATCLQ